MSNLYEWAFTSTVRRESCEDFRSTSVTGTIIAGSRDEFDAEFRRMYPGKVTGLPLDASELKLALEGSRANLAQALRDAEDFRERAEGGEWLLGRLLGPQPAGDIYDDEANLIAVVRRDDLITALGSLVGYISEPIDRLRVAAGLEVSGD